MSCEIAILDVKFFNLLCRHLSDKQSGLGNVVLAAQSSLVVYVDIYRIEHVIRNLITNAVS